jgi:hypothetical protein
MPWANIPMPKVSPPGIPKPICRTFGYYPTPRSSFEEGCCGIKAGFENDMSSSTKARINADRCSSSERFFAAPIRVRASPRNLRLWRKLGTWGQEGANSADRTDEKRAGRPAYKAGHSTRAKARRNSPGQRRARKRISSYAARTSCLRRQGRAWYLGVHPGK